MPIECYYNTKEIIEENNDKNEVLPIYLFICGKIFLEHRKECQCCKKIIKTIFFHFQDKKKKFENENKNKITPLIIKEEFSYENLYMIKKI